MKTMDDNDRRLSKAEENIETLFGKFNTLNASQVRTETTLEHLLVAIGRLENAVDSLKARPGDRWLKLVDVVVAALVAAAVAYFIGGR